MNIVGFEDLNDPEFMQQYIYSMKCLNCGAETREKIYKNGEHSAIAFCSDECVIEWIDNK